MFKGTTILSVRKPTKVVLIGDGQVTLGQSIFKSNAKKIRRAYKNQVIAGFAGSTADAFTLFEKFEGKLEEHGGKIMRASVELAKEWRTNKMLRNLEAMLCVANAEHSFIISGNGDVIEPEDGVMAIGSGGQYALSAARALLNNTKLDAKNIALKSMQIAASICVYTNDQFCIEELEV